MIIFIETLCFEKEYLRSIFGKLMVLLCANFRHKDLLLQFVITFVFKLLTVADEKIYLK